MSAVARSTVLVVDDEREILVALEDLLEAEHRVIACSDPSGALERLRSEPDVAVILSDQRMPQMPGNRFLAAAREISDAEAILLTGHADMEAVIAAINDGKVSGYVHKPWDNADLLTMVRLAAERHRIRRALDLERRLFDGLLAGATDTIRLFDAGGTLLRSNRPGEQLLDAEDRTALSSGEASAEEMESEAAWLRIQRVPLTQPSGERLLLRIESDLTRERQLERRLRQAEKLEALGTLAGGIAHDFNNLLTAVIGNLELATRRPDHPGVPRFVEGALVAARRGASLTARLLSFSRQTGGDTRVVDLHEVIEGMADLLARTLGGGVRMQIEQCDPGFLVRVDPDQLELALLNLCVNARDAMGGMGTIVLGCTADRIGEGAPGGLAPGDYVRIAVSDTGTGMSRDTLARAFDPFFTTKPVGKGTGLGLSMVYGFATALGGGVQVDSVEGRGTTVVILLPRADGAPTAIEEEGGTPPETAALSVLLVEDDAAVREVTRRHLEALGHSVHVADRPAEALAVLDRDGAVDLVVTDFAMPGVSGLDFVAAARARRPGLPALLLTGYAEGATVPDDVRRLAKPFTPESLARALAETMAGAGRRSTG